MARTLQLHVCGSFPERELSVYAKKYWLRVDPARDIDPGRRFVFKRNTKLAPEKRCFNLTDLRTLTSGTKIKLTFSDANKAAVKADMQALFANIPADVSVTVFGRPMKDACEFDTIIKAASGIGDKAKFLRKCKAHFSTFLTTPNRISYPTKYDTLADWDNLFDHMGGNPFVIKIPGKGGTGLLFIMNEGDLTAAKRVFASSLFPLSHELSLEDTLIAPEVLIEEYMTADQSLNISFTITENKGVTAFSNQQATIENVIEGGHIGNRSLRTGVNAMAKIQRVVDEIIDEIIIPTGFIGNGGIDLFVRRNPFRIVMVMEANPRTNGSCRQEELARKLTGWNHVYTDVKEIELHDTFDAEAMDKELARMQKFVDPFGLKVATYRAFSNYVGIMLIGRKADCKFVPGLLDVLISTCEIGKVKYANKLGGHLSPDHDNSAHPTITFYEELMAQ